MKNELLKAHRSSNNLRGVILLLDSVSKITKVAIAEITGRSRIQESVYARTVFVALAKSNYPELSHALIGSIINRDHSTVTYMIAETRDVKEKAELLREVEYKLNVQNLEYVI